MPVSGEHDVTHGELRQSIGQLQGEMEGIRATQTETKTDIRDIYTKVNEGALVDARIEDKVDQLLERPSTTVMRQSNALQKTKPWEKPLGDLMGEILIGALKIIGIGITVALIMYGIGRGKF